MFECEFCRKDFDVIFASGRFCGRSCANKWVNAHKTAEQKLKQGNRKSHIAWNKGLTKEGDERVRKYVGTGQATLRKYHDKKISEKDFSLLDHVIRSRIVTKEQEGRCAICKVVSWEGKPLKLHYDHINGQHQDNRRENARMICPNCHSQTSTYTGRNKNAHQIAVSDEIFLSALLSSPNIRQALIKLKLSPRGSNYFRAHDLLNKHRIDSL